MSHWLGQMAPEQGPTETVEVSEMPLHTGLSSVIEPLQPAAKNKLSKNHHRSPDRESDLEDSTQQRKVKLYHGTRFSKQDLFIHGLKESLKN